MPTPSQQSSRVPVFLLLVGSAGLLASGLGVLPLTLGWGFMGLMAMGALLRGIDALFPLVSARAGAHAFDSEERLANDRARESMKWAEDRQERLLKDMADAVAKVEASALQPGEAMEMRKAFVSFAADLQLVKQELVEMKESENRRKFGTTLRGEPEST